MWQLYKCEINPVTRWRIGRRRWYGIEWYHVNRLDNKKWGTTTFSDFPLIFDTDDYDYAKQELESLLAVKPRTEDIWKPVP